MEKSGEDPLRYVITDCKIAIGRGPILAESRSALPERSISVRQLTLGAEQTC